MKILLLILATLTTQTTLLSQIITVSVVKSYNYNQESNAYTFYIVEELRSLQISHPDEKTRTIQFNERMEIVYNFLDANNLPYRILETDPAILNRKPKRPIQLKRVDLEILSPSNTRNNVMTFVNEQPGLIFRNNPVKRINDNTFMQSCYEDLEVEARKKADTYTSVQNTMLDEIYEIEIINHIVTRFSSGKYANNNTDEQFTHTAMFEMKYSFKTSPK